MTKALRGHKTHLKHRHGLVRAELDLCVHGDRSVSVAGDLSMQEKLCNFI